MRTIILEKLKSQYIDVQGLRVKEKDYSDNPLAPETVVYYITFRSFGNLIKLAYYPNTVGFQGRK